MCFFIYYSLNKKKTDIIKKAKPIKWLVFKTPVLKIKIFINVNTIKVMHSCNTFNCTREKGPPVSLNPRRLAGIKAQYSKKAIPQLTNMTENVPKFDREGISLNFKLLYHANVIMVFDKNKSNTV